MKSIFNLFKYTACTIVMMCMVQTVSAQTQLSLTVNYTSSTFDNENGWELQANGAQVATYATGDTGPASITACVLPGDALDLYTYESFGDGWGGSSVDVVWGGTSLTGGPIFPPSSGNGNCCAAAGTGDLVWSGAAPVPACVMTCPADQAVSTAPGTCVPGFSTITPPTVDANCLNLPGDCMTIDGAEATLLMDGTGLITTPFDIAGAVPVPAAALACVTEVCITVTMVADIGGAGFEQTDILGETGLVIGQNGTSAGDCNAAGGVSVICVPVADWNAWAADGTVSLSIVTDPDIDNICASQTIQASAEVCTSCQPFINDFNGTADASDVYPLGTTTVTFTSIDLATGGEVKCSFDVTVSDLEPPVLACPGDATINLDPGACGQVTSFEVTATDNCPQTAYEVVGPYCNPCNDPTGGSALACGAGPNGIIQAIDVTASEGDSLTGVCFNQETFGTTTTVTINVYCDPGGGAIPFDDGAGTFTPLYTEDVTLSAADNGACVCVDFAAYTEIPAGCGTLYVEFFNATGRSVQTPPACDGATADGTLSWIVAPACGATTPTTFQGIGFALDASYALTVLPAALEAVPDPAAPAGYNAFESGDELPIGTHCFQWIATDGEGNTSTCDWCITVEGFPTDLVTSTLACNDDVNISVDENCEVTLTADMFLEGGPYACYQNYILNVTPLPGAMTGNGTSAVTINAGAIAGWNGMAGPYEVSVVDTANNNNSCWGNFMLEDKLPPVVTCEDATITCLTSLAPGNSVSGTVLASSTDANGQSWDDGTTGEGLATASATSAGAPAGAQVTDVNVYVELDHSWMGDVTITLTGPNGASVVLVDGDCGANDNLAATFDDEAPTGPSCAACAGSGAQEDCETTAQPCATLSTQYQPSAGSLAAFVGANPNGNWTISLDDAVGGDGGCLKAFNVAVGWAINRASAPTVTENCSGSPAPDFSDAVIFSDDCIADTIARTWIATDAKGNTGSCVQTIVVENVGLELVELPPAVVNLDCGEGTDPASIAASQGVAAAYPLVAGSPIVNGSTCSLFYTYTDQEIPACAPGCNGNLKVIRTWTLIDWCNAGDPPATHTQVIKAVDNDGPTVVELTGSTDLSVDPWSCSYSGDLPAPLLHDECTESITYTVSGPPGVDFFPFPGHPDYPLASGESYEIIGAPKGQHDIIYTAVDCCGNPGVTTITINVYDGTAPVAIGTQNIVLSLTSDGGTGSDNGTAKIYTNSVNNGSYDGCTDVHIEIRRAADACSVSGNTTYDNTGHPNDSNNDFDGGQFVKFCCGDIYDASGAAANTDTYADGTSVDWNIVPVWMRVWDDGDMDGVFGSAGDNYNETWVNVRVENKFVPQINCVPDVALSCNMDYEDLSMTGEATAVGLCGDLCTGYTDVADVDGCGVGSVFRFWWIDFNCNGVRDAEDFQYFCALPQTITMTALTPFDGSINWPRDYTGEPGQFPALTPAQGCDAMTGEPDWNDNVCSLIAADVDIDTFEFEEGACYKVLKHWTVIDWCEFDANDPDLNTVADPLDDGVIPGYWIHTQVIKYIDTEKPEFEACADDMFEVDGACQNNSVMLFRTATDDGGCSADSSTWLKWYVTVDLWGDGTVDYEFTTFGNENGNINSDGDGNGIPGRGGLSATASGGEFKVDLTGVSIEGSMFNHVVQWKVTDGCGNNRSCSSTFMVVDKKAPTPYCVDLSTALMENGMVEFWACDFDLGAFDNCTASENLLFTFDDYTPDVNYLNVPHYYNSNSTAIGFPPNVPASYLAGTTRYWDGINCAGRAFTTCGENPVQIYVWDEKLNVDFCDVTLLVGGEECVDGTRLIGGDVVTEAGVGVENIEMSNLSDIILPNEMTDDAGHYAFTAFEAFDYTITGEKMDDYMNGVSTLDLVLIQKHILGLQDLDSPYKVIAADVNNNSDVSALDLVELRKLILGVYAELPSNASWRLVDANQTFADNLDPFPFNEELDVVNLSQDEMAENFIAVKIGDVTESATPNVQSVSSEVRSNKSLQLEINEATVNAGEEVSIDVMSSNFAEVFGYQFTMNLSGATLDRIEAGALNITNSNVGVLNNNTVTMSWSDANGVSAKANDVLFTIVLQATETTNTSELISVNSNVTRAEAYLGATTEIVNVELGVRTDDGTEIVSAFELFQNEPNPFDGNTQIGFNLPEAGNATLTIYDVAGKVVKIVRNDYERGYNTIEINKADLGVAGVLYYQLESGDFTATKKMIVIK